MQRWPDILFEDNHLIAINKQPGMLVQADVTGDRPISEMLKEYIKTTLHKPGAVFLGVVHRLDRPVSGVVIFARTSKALERMNALFRNKKTEKTYWAIVGKPPPKEADDLVHWLVKDERQNKTRWFKREHPAGQKSVLHYKVRDARDRGCLLEIRPETGRPHQIRAQLAAIGSPIIGDLKYGYPDSNADASICLHARRLAFVHPVRGEVVTIVADVPGNGAWDGFDVR